MSLFSTPEEHAANPPETWQVRRLGRIYEISAAGRMLGGFRTKRQAIAHRTSGFFITLYEQERRWYAGEPVVGWKPYEAVR